MDLSVFFQSLNEELVELLAQIPSESLGKQLQAFTAQFPHWQEADIVLIGCEETRTGSKGLMDAANAIRKKLYTLSVPFEKLKIADLGNLKPKDSIEAYNEVLAYVMNQLFQSGKPVLLLGGSQHIAYGQYMAYEELNEDIEYVQIDSRFDMDDPDTSKPSESYNRNIFLHQPNYLFNFTNLGYQSYFVSDQQRKTLNEMNFFAVRYGNLYRKIEEVEPHLRTADMISFDISSIRHVDAPGSVFPSPGGFSAMESCRLARYAGLAYGVRSMSFCELDTEIDIHGQSSLLVAMMIWYFLDGFYHRRDDKPRDDRANLRKYSVQLHASIDAIHFYQHPTSGRWWMEVPYQSSLGKRFPRTRLVACSETDYEFAKSDNIPERWWLVYNKLKD